MIFKDFASGSQIVSLEVFYLPPRNPISLKKFKERTDASMHFDFSDFL